MRAQTSRTNAGPTSPTTTDAGDVDSGKGIKTGDFVWLTWHQQKWTIITSILLAALFCFILLATNWILTSFSACTHGTSPICMTSHGSTINIGVLEIRALAILPGLVAVFWGAPLVSREFEMGTHVVAWGQDVSPGRWLLLKTLVLTCVSGILALAIGLAARPLNSTLLRVRAQTGDSAFNSLHFEANVPMIVPYTVLALVLGIAAGALIRRVLPAIAAAAVAFTAIRFGLATWARPHYLPSAHTVAPLSSSGPQVGRNALLLVDNQYGTRGGSPRAIPSECSAVATSIHHFYACLKQHGISARVSLFQPASRLHSFEIIETGICVIAAGLILILTILQLQRHRAVG